MSLRGLTTDDLIDELGITKRSVNRWLAAGLPHDETPNGKRFNLDEVHTWMLDNGRGTSRGRQFGQLQGPGGHDIENMDAIETKEELLKAKLRKEIAQATRYELDVQQRRGELLEKSEVERGRLDRIARARAVLLGGPPTLAADLEGLNLEERERRIREWVLEALGELSRE